MEPGTPLVRVAALVFTVALLSGPAGSAQAGPGSTLLVSVRRGGDKGGNGLSSTPVLSANGNVVAFLSDASDLVHKDRNGTSDVFARDLRRQTTTLVSVARAGKRSGNDVSGIFAPAVSSDGTVIAFDSYASDLVAGDENGAPDVFVRDLSRETTTLVSVDVTGTGSGDHASSQPTISANGRFVAFTSSAHDLVSVHANGFGDVYVRDLEKGETSLLSIAQHGLGSGSGRSFSPVINANGRYVAFVSGATNLVDLPIVDRDIFVRDLKRRTTTLVSVNHDGSAGGNRQSYEPRISANGRFVAFLSDATDLVPNDPGDGGKLYVRDLARGTTTLVTVDAQGSPVSSAASTSHALSANGRFLTFASWADGIVPGDHNGVPDLFVRDLARSVTKLVNADRLGRPGGNGSDLFFWPAISASGRFVAFVSDADTLVEGDDNQASDVFVRDVALGVTSLASDGRGGAGSGDDASGVPSGPTISASGRRVAFGSLASNLVPQPTRVRSNVFVRALR